MRMELHLPEQASAARGETFNSKRRIQRWLEELEQAPDREVGARFIEGLKHFNRTRLRTGRRLKAAEQLRPMARHLIGRAMQRISAQELPLTETSRRNFKSLLRLLRETALSYDIVAQSLAQARRPPRRHLALALERALYYRGETMLRSAPIHAPLPQSFWHDSNVLYQLAQTHGCVDRRVRNDELVVARRKRQSPGEMYTRLLLFGLMPTEALRRGQTERLYLRTESWCRAAVFPATRPDNASVLYYVDLDGAAGPQPGRPDESDPLAPAGDSVQLLDLASVLAEAERALPNAPSENAVLEKDQVDAAALRRLVDTWSGRRQRGSVRKERREPADVEASLRRIHARLVADEAPTESDGKTRTRPTGSLATLALQTIEQDPGHEWQRGSSQRPGQLRDLPGAWGASEEERAKAAAPSRKTPKEKRNWALLDVSGTGFRLRWTGEESSTVNVGELVALRQELPGADASSAHQERWIIGVVRRIQLVGERHFDAGIEMLGQYPVPAVIRREPAKAHRKRDARSEPGETALMLPALKSRAIPPTVVAPAHMFQEGDTLELVVHERTMRIQLGSVRDSSAAFTRFDIGPARPRGRSARE